MFGIFTVKDNLYAVKKIKKGLRPLCELALLIGVPDRVYFYSKVVIEKK